METNNLDFFVRTYDNMVDPLLCRDWINQYEIDARKERIDRAQRPTFSELNISKLYEEDEFWTEVQNKVQRAFIDAVQVYMEDILCAPDFPDKYAFEQFRIKSYNTNGDQFKDHVDVQDYGSARRFLVVMLYLNEVTSGGRTYFHRTKTTIDPKPGRILLFPANWMYRHAGLPPVSNNKYILGSYLHYL